MISQTILEKMYITEKKSVHEIATTLKCSDNKVTYWLHKHNIPKRSISEAIYIQQNLTGDPYTFSAPTTKDDWLLFGLGLGLFWGEGNKVNKNSVRLGNTDPQLIKTFLTFLRRFYQVNEQKLRFGIQIFSDCDKDKALEYWSNELAVPPSQFQKIIITPSRRAGTYRHKNYYGVLTIYFHNTKLRDTIVGAITELQTNSYANVAQMVERIHGKSQ